ncbi:MAG: hypothetical protein M1816_006937 [Peltula sp. TS41687]|nr:MAG: hypothetical protein M1816_006937 [Peltula sp. TS41687]
MFFAPHHAVLLRLISSRISPSPSCFAFTRNISLNSSIERGLRRSRRPAERSGLSSSSSRDRGRDWSNTGRKFERSREGGDDRGWGRTTRGDGRSREGGDDRGWGRTTRGDGRSREGGEDWGKSSTARRAEGFREGDGSGPQRKFRRPNAERLPASGGPGRGRERPPPMVKNRRSRESDEHDGGYQHPSSSYDRSRRSSDFPSPSPSSSYSSSSRNPRMRTMTPTRPSRYDMATSDSRTAEEDEAYHDGVTSVRRSQPSSFGLKIPLAVPYTTSASEFLYGTSVVMAALRSRRRRFYKLYIYEADNRQNPGRDKEMERLARDAGVQVGRVQGDWIRLMDKMSAGRPHNGYILEASPLPRLPATALEPIQSSAEKSFQVVLDRQSKEEQDVNGTDPAIPYSGSAKDGGARYPLVMMLDGILDPGNLGNILRSAHFFGVDAIAICARNSAPLSPIALKASAGSSEYIPLISIADPASFMESSSRNGWKFYAAVAPPAASSATTQAATSASASASPSASPSPKTSSSSSNGSNGTTPKYISTDDLRSPLAKQAVVLMVGGEGEGLRWALRRKADEEVGIEGKSDRKESGVDSLNVSVAAGVLCEAFFRGGGGIDLVEDDEESLTEEEKVQQVEEEMQKQQERLF